MLSVFTDCFWSLKAPAPKSVCAFPNLPYFSAAHEILPSKAVCSHFSCIQYLLTFGSKIHAQINCCSVCQQHLHLIPRAHEEILLASEKVFRLFSKRNSEINGRAKTLITIQAYSREGLPLGQLGTKMYCKDFSNDTYIGLKNG